MNINFRIGLPETFGLAVLGSTVAALLAGAGSGGFKVNILLAALAGAALPFVFVIVPRLGRSDRA